MASGTSPNARILTDVAREQHTSGWRVGRAVGASILWHVVGALIVLWVTTHRLQPTVGPGPTVRSSAQIVWLDHRGPGDGGGGGGKGAPRPARSAEAPGTQALTVPARTAVSLEPVVSPDTPRLEQQIVVPAVPTASGVHDAIGVVSALPSVPDSSQGPGTGAGAGTGRGPGSGDGEGAGLDRGRYGGTGGGTYHIGNGVSAPRLIREVQPAYTPGALRAQVQGLVVLRAVVLPDGSVGDVQILRSLDATFGLDAEALRTVRQWRFLPGLRLGQPVAVLVEIELQFTLR